MNYNEFLNSKADYGADSGFEPLWMPDFLFDFQQFFLNRSIRRGRAADFADCGLGKSVMELVFAQNCIQKTNKPSLLLTPLAVTGQMLEEARKFGIEARRAVPGENHKTIQVINYEQLHKFNPLDYGGVICDESSILKSYSGTRRKQITEFMRHSIYGLLATATASPNSWNELGTSSEALGYLGHRDMESRFFKRQQVFAKTSRGRQKEFQLLHWAEKGPFWQWVASWATAARKPSDLGPFSDEKFNLPELIEKDILVKARNSTPGMLFDMEAVGFHEIREAQRRTIQERCEKAAEIVAQLDGAILVWCNLNQEGNLLEKLIPGAVQVAGRHSDEHKINSAYWFKHGTDSKRVLISKPKIFGWGMDWSQVEAMTVFPTFSYEAYYQQVRRAHRFGRKTPLTVYRVYTDGGIRMLDAIKVKSKKADRMFDRLVQYMNQAVHIENPYKPMEVELPKWMQNGRNK